MPFLAEISGPRSIFTSIHCSRQAWSRFKRFSCLVSPSFILPTLALICVRGSVEGVIARRHDVVLATLRSQAPSFASASRVIGMTQLAVATQQVSQSSGLRSAMQMTPGGKGKSMQMPRTVHLSLRVRHSDPASTAWAYAEGHDFLAAKAHSIA